MLFRGFLIKSHYLEQTKDIEEVAMEGGMWKAFAYHPRRGS